MNVVEQSIHSNIAPDIRPNIQLSPESLRRIAKEPVNRETSNNTWQDVQLMPPKEARRVAQENWSDSIQTVLEQPPAALPRYLLLLGLAFTTVFGTWAYAGHIQEVAKATGELVPQGETYKVQLPITGEVDRILVTEGDFVEEGQLLLALDADLLQEELVRLEQTLLAHERELLRVQSLTENTHRESAMQAQIAASSIHAEQSAITLSQANTHTNEQLLEQLKESLFAQEERLARISPLEEKGAISKEYLFSIEEGVREQQQRIEQTQGEIAQSLARTQQAEAGLSQRLSEAQQIDITTQRALQRLAIEAEQRQADIADTQNLIEQAKFKLSQSNVRSPVSGIVSTLEIDNIGEVIGVGETLAEVRPAEMPLVLSAMVPQQEAGLIEVGMEANIKLDAFPYQDYGILQGEVMSISPDTKGNEETGSGYQVEIALEKDHVVHQERPVMLRAGEAANADIVVRRRRLLDLILDPIRRLRADDLSL